MLPSYTLLLFVFGFGKKVESVNVEPRIINGAPVTDPNKYIYIANVGTCSATLVAPNVLLSAAHCWSPTFVTLNKPSGDTNNRRQSRTLRDSIRVVDEIRHPNYVKVGTIYNEYDFKLIRIMGYSLNSPVELDDGDSGYTDTGTKLTVMGWGITEEGTVSEVLREVEVDLIDFSECNSAYLNVNEQDCKTQIKFMGKCETEFELKEDIMFCAGRTEGGTTYDACTGDSGGPIVKRNAGNNGNDVQVGVVSFGYGCANPEYPGVYARVSAVKDWIEETIGLWDCKRESRRRQLKKTAPKPTKAKKTKKIQTKSPSFCEAECSVSTSSTPSSSVPACEILDHCAFVLNDSTIWEAVTLYKQDQYAAIDRYGNPEHWMTEDVTDMSFLFYKFPFDIDISNWDTSNVVSMKEMFAYDYIFNQDLSSWTTSKVTDMSAMFYFSSKFNQDLNSWNVAKVKNMLNMFIGASSFNGNISTWNTEKVTSMMYMLAGASKFNGKLNSWNTGKVTNMDFMFDSAITFNGNLSSWNIEKVETMIGMFNLAASFSQNLCAWSNKPLFPNEVSTSNMFSHSACPIQSNPTEASVCHGCSS